MHENDCEGCLFERNMCDNNYKNNPCNTCIIWQDGYLTFTNYKNIEIEDVLKQKFYRE